MYNNEYNINNTEYKYNKIHPKLEILRKKILDKLFEKFYQICLKYDNNFKRNKSIDFITRFCWRNISDIDPVLPIKQNYDCNQLILDLNNYNINGNEIVQKLSLNKFFNKNLLKFDKLYNKINYNKNIKINKIDYNLIYKNKYKISYTQQILDKLIKYYKQLDNLEYDKYTIIFCLLYRYNYLDSDNQQLAINLSLKNDLMITYGINTELFGSGINRFFNNYCSLFYDLEKYFGSLGNFFNINIQSGLYMANPPYDEELMTNMSLKLIKLLNNTNKPLGFIITVPVWDEKTSIDINKICNTKINNYPIYKCKEILVKSKYFYKEYIFCKNKFPYYNFSNSKYINACNTYIFIIKNDLLKFDLNKFDDLLKKNKLFYINFKKKSI